MQHPLTFNSKVHNTAACIHWPYIAPCLVYASQMSHTTDSARTTMAKVASEDDVFSLIHTVHKAVKVRRVAVVSSGNMSFTDSAFIDKCRYVQEL